MNTASEELKQEQLEMIQDAHHHYFVGEIEQGDKILHLLEVSLNL